MCDNFLLIFYIKRFIFQITDFLVLAIHLTPYCTINQVKFIVSSVIYWYVLEPTQKNISYELLIFYVLY